jgi:hypothetical protein
MITDFLKHSRYAAGLLISLLVFGVINFVHSSRRVYCFDCYSPTGLPFTFYHQGGFAGGASFVWSGIAADLLVIIVVGMVIGWIAKNIYKMRSGQ